MALAFSLPLFAGGRLTAGLQAGQLRPQGQPGIGPPVRAGDGLQRQAGVLRLSPGQGVLGGRRGGPGPGREIHGERQEPLRGRHGLEVRPAPLGGPGGQSQAPGDPGPQQRRSGRARPEDRPRPRPRHARSRSRASSPRRPSTSISRGHRRGGPGRSGRSSASSTTSAGMAGRDAQDRPRLDAADRSAIGGAYNFWSDALNLRKGTWENYYTINLSLDPARSSTGSRPRPRSASPRPCSASSTGPRKGLSDAITLEVRQAVLNHNQARETLLSQEKNVEQAREAVRIAELNYRRRAGHEPGRPHGPGRPEPGPDQPFPGAL